jgi:hypothetical protein
MIFENNHPAIIDQSTWELAQKMRQTKRRHEPLGEANPLTGLLFCADCGSKLHNHRARRKGHICSYICSEYRKGRGHFLDNHCSQHYVSTRAVRAILLDVIQKTTSFVQKHEDEFVRMIREASCVQQAETIKTHNRKIAKNQRRIAELDKMFLSLYGDKVKGLISEERFLQMSKSCEQEQTHLKEQTAILQAEVNAHNEDSGRVDSFLMLVQKYTRIGESSHNELTTQMLYEFVDKVIIHEAIWSEATETQKRKGTRSQQIDVHLKYIGNFNIPDTRSLEEIEAERIEEEKLADIRERKRKYSREYYGRKRRVVDSEKAAAASDEKKAQKETTTITKKGMTA